MNFQPHSSYFCDPRVQWPEEGWQADIIAAIRESYDAPPNRAVMATADTHFVVNGINGNDALTVVDRQGSPWQFDNVDDALAAVLGDALGPDTQRVERPDGRRVYAEINPRTGLPQVFPFTEVDERALMLAAQYPGNSHLQEVAAQVSDHRSSYNARHTEACHESFARGLCH